MAQTHDIFLRAYAVAAKKKKKQKNPKQKKQIHSAPVGTEPKWAQRALVFDTETRITADQSLTFGVYRLCTLVADVYTVTEEGIFYADDLPAKERKVLESHIKTAVSDVASFPRDSRCTLAPSS